MHKQEEEFFAPEFTEVNLLKSFLIFQAPEIPPNFKQTGTSDLPIFPLGIDASSPQFDHNLTCQRLHHCAEKLGKYGFLIREAHEIYISPQDYALIIAPHHNYFPSSQDKDETVWYLLNIKNPQHPRTFIDIPEKIAQQIFPLVFQLAAQRIQTEIQKGKLVTFSANVSGIHHQKQEVREKYRPGQSVKFLHFHFDSINPTNLQAQNLQPKSLSQLLNITKAKALKECGLTLTDEEALTWIKLLRYPEPIIQAWQQIDFNLSSNPLAHQIHWHLPEDNIRAPYGLEITFKNSTLDVMKQQGFSLWQLLYSIEITASTKFKNHGLESDTPLSKGLLPSYNYAILFGPSNIVIALQALKHGSLESGLLFINPEISQHQNLAGKSAIIHRPNRGET